MISTHASATRFSLAVGLVVLAFGFVASRLCQLALVDADRLSDLARRQHVGREEFKPLRGSILDRSGEPLAISIESDSIYLRPHQFSRAPQDGAVAQTLGLSAEQWIQKVSSHSGFVWLKRQASSAELASIRELGVSGVGTVVERRRFYPRGRLAAAVIGFAGIDSQGLEGIELAYDRFLSSPESAVGVERDALGRKIFARGVESGPRRGADVVLTIDSAIQYVAERELDRQVTETRAQGGLLLVLDPRTGEILALAQNPSFDPNELRLASPDGWRNRAVADAYEPGSTMKGLLAATALEEGVASREEKFYCENGQYTVGGRTIHDHHGHGWLTFAEILQVSSNIGATKIAERVGADRYARRLRAFGLGERTGVDLVGEQAGIVRSPAEWRLIDLATASFGQGIAVTPIQLASAYAALANGGVRMRPYLVRRIADEDGEVVFENRPTVVRRVVSEQTAREVTEMLEGVVNTKGTAEKAAIPDVRVAGKTGTAQKVDFAHGGYSRGRIASFIGYFPAENPKALILTIVDEPQTSTYGGLVAAPVFRAVASAVLERLGIRPDALAGKHAAASFWETAKTTDSSTHDREASMRNEETSFIGLSLREALERARREGFAVEIVGSGYVTRQDPPPGTAPEPGRTLRLELASVDGSNP